MYIIIVYSDNINNLGYDFNDAQPTYLFTLV